MKKLFLFPIFILSLYSFGQSEFEKTYFNKPYTDTFKNESVVIARMMEESSYQAYGINDYKITFVFRAQYLLKDISALNSFSTLSKYNDVKKYELKQIKPDGKVNVIYEFFDKNYPDDGYDIPEDEDEEKKKPEEIPLEGLEIGDIIDYKYEFTYTTKTKDFRKVLLKNGKSDKVIAEVSNDFNYKYLLFKNKFIENSYPIASSVVVIHAPEELHLIQKSFNCNYSFTSKTNSGKTTHECPINLVKAYKSEDFSYSYLHLPTIKYALVQSNAEKKAFYPYQFESTSVEKEEIAALGKKLYADKTYISKYLFYLNTQAGNEAYKQTTLNSFFTSFLKTFTKKDKDNVSKLNKLHEYLTNNDKLNQKPFGEIAYAVIMARFCDKLGIKYKLMAALNKYDGKWNEVISPYEISWGLYIPNKNRDIFITNYDEESNIYQRSGSFSGTEIILIDTKNDKNTMSTMEYPEIPASENLYHQESEIRLSDDKEYDYNFTNSVTITGNQKYNISNYIKNQFDHERLRTPYKFFGLVNYDDIYNWKEFSTNEEWFEEFTRIDSSYRLYFKNYYKDRMLAFLYNEYEFMDISIDSSRIKNDGEFADADSSIYGFKTYFKVNDFIENDSSSVLIMHLGKLITGQYQVSNYNVEKRYGDVYISNLKELHWINSVEIPEGYTCVNLDDFNINFENEAGIFKTIAEVKDGKIQFSVTKLYKTHYLPKEKWMEMVEFLHTAEKMFMKKLLLQKN